MEGWDIIGASHYQFTRNDSGRIRKRIAEDKNRSVIRPGTIALLSTTAPADCADQGSAAYFEYRSAVGGFESFEFAEHYSAWNTGPNNA